MMVWENLLMVVYVKVICVNGGYVLNVGFGMGLVDIVIQGYNLVFYIIIEVYFEVYKRMLEIGWGEKFNVCILFGCW